MGSCVFGYEIIFHYSHSHLPCLVTFLAFVYSVRRVWRDLRVFLLLLANEELPLVATGDKASPESCRTVCKVAMVGGGEEEEWKEGGGE